MTESVPFNAQAIFEKNPAFKSMRKQCTRVLRDTYVRPLADIDKPTHALQDKRQRRLLRQMLITRESQLRMQQRFHSDKISSEKINELVQRFFLHEYVQCSRFFIAGGFLLRMLEQPEVDIGVIAEQHDIDIFYRESQHVYDWITTLRANGCTVTNIGEKKWHNLFRVETRSEPRPFLIQFTHTSADGIYELLESFDFPICQIGVDLSRRCFTTFGFDAVWDNRKDAVMILNKDEPVGAGTDITGKQDEPHADNFWAARVAKYEARGYRFKFVPELVLYGRTRFVYGDYIKESEITHWGTVDPFFASQTWFGDKKETWAERVRRHAKEDTAKGVTPESKEQSVQSDSEDDEPRWFDSSEDDD